MLVGSCFSLFIGMPLCIMINAISAPRKIMEGYFPLMLFILIVYGIYKYMGKKHETIHVSTVKASPKRSSNNKKTEDNDWLEERWKMAEQQKLANVPGMFPAWYFYPATAAQIKRLISENIQFKKANLTKGKASDLIGLTEEASDHNLEVLKFFKLYKKGMNQTAAQHIVNMTLQDEDALARWNNRPPDALQKEYCRFFNIKLSKKMSKPEVSKIISDHENILSEAEDPRLKDWEDYETIIDELSDADIRSDYGIKKPSSTLIRKAIDSLLSDGKSYSDISSNIDDLINRLIEIKPDLERD